MRVNRLLWCVVVIYLAALALAGFHFRNALNTDAIAYLRIAGYYAERRWDLAVSGYWGPLASWIMAVILRGGCSPLPAARCFMAFSAVVFFCGALAVYRTFRLPDKWIRAGTILAAAAGVYWSVLFITPDLLAAGLISLAVCRSIPPNGQPGWAAPVQAGVLWGLAYLAKAVALPLAFASTVVFAWLAHRESPAERRCVVRNAVVTVFVFGLVAVPWIVTLSLKYGRLTFSTAPAIARAVTGPPDVDRYHPFARHFQQPAPGRVTSWEDPAIQDYKTWSPFESGAYAAHQLKVMGRNALTCFVLITSLNLAWPLAVLGLMRRRQLGVDKARTTEIVRALALPFLLVLIYVPAYVSIAEQRFFYGAFPFLFAVIGILASAAGEVPASSRRLLSQNTLWRVAVVAAVIPLVLQALVVRDRLKQAGDCAADLALRIRQAGITGPIAGSGSLPGGRTGLYVAFLLDQPWYGDEQNPAVEDFHGSGARLIAVTRNSPIAEALGHSPEFVNLDHSLFADAGVASRYPLIVYERGGGPLNW